MLKQTRHGWSRFELECTFPDGVKRMFVGTPSYIENAPLYLIQVFINYYKNGSAAMTFEEEGHSFTFILSDDGSVYLIRHNPIGKMVAFEVDRDIKDLTKEAYEDVSSHIHEWAEWFSAEPDAGEILENEEKLLEALDELNFLNPQN